MIKALTSWRGLLAIIIVIYHYHVYTGYLAAIGGTGMSFFFMVSGFMLARKYHFDSLDRHSYLAFEKKRFLRIYPLYLLTTLAIAAFSIPKLASKWVALLASLTFTQSYFPDKKIYFSFNGAAWFLSCIALCYLLFPLISRCTRSVKPVRVYAVLAVLLVFASVVFSLLDHVTGLWFIYIFPPVRVIDFACGVMLWKVVENKGDKPVVASAKVATAIEVIMVAMVAVLTYLQKFETNDIGYGRIITITVYSLFIVTFYRLNECGGWVTRLLSLKPLYVLGLWSFDIYMLHYPTHLLMRTIYKKAEVDHDSYLYLAIYVMVLLIITFLWRKVDKRVRNRIKVKTGG